MESTFKGLVTDFKSLNIKEDCEQLPLEEGEVRIKIFAAPVNPSDYYFSKGSYGPPEEGVLKGVGFEGAGEIVELGAGVPETALGQKVAFSQSGRAENFQGTYRQYATQKYETIFPYPETADYDLICSSFVNPLTVCGFVDIVEKSDSNALIHDAAASQVGRQLNRFAASKGITVINIIRSQEQADILKEIGATVILNSSEDSFYDDLASAIKEHNPLNYFSAIGGGDMVKKVTQAMPRFSTCLIYGTLGTDDVSYNGGQFIFKQTTISSFYLPVWLETLKPEEKKKWIGSVIADLSTGGKLFLTKIRKTYPLAEFESAFKDSMTNSTGGKILFHPQE